MANYEIIGAGQDTARPAPNTEYPPVLDVCCGSKIMWFDKNDSRAFFVDKRTGVFDLCQNRSNGQYQSPIVVKPDRVCDFTDLPFPDCSFSLVVFDPPHAECTVQTGDIIKRYGRLEDGWQNMLKSGFSECFRVLKPSGILVFKWSSVYFPLKDILKLTPEKPLFGHPSGKRMNTHWVAFIKQESPVLGEESPAQINILLTDPA